MNRRGGSSFDSRPTVGLNGQRGCAEIPDTAPAPRFYFDGSLDRRDLAEHPQVRKRRKLPVRSEPTAGCARGCATSDRRRTLPRRGRILPLVAANLPIMEMRLIYAND